MGSFSIWHWLIIVMMIAITIVPLANILRRTGHSPFLAILAFVPFVNFICYWVFAFKQWPIDVKSDSPSRRIRIEPDL